MARRHRVDERPVVVVAALAGIVAALSDASPTGNGAIDAILMFTAVAFVVWCAASAPWWLLAVTATAAMAMAGGVWLLVIGAVAFVGALWIGLQRRELAVERAVVAAIAFNVLVRAEVDPALGVSAGWSASAAGCSWSSSASGDAGEGRSGGWASPGS